MKAKQKILVTGGAGYIGSFIVRELKKNGYNCVIVDSLSQGHKASVNGFKLYKVDLVEEKDALSQIFKKEKFAGVIHMAAFIQMGESFSDPLKYFDNNLKAAINLLEVMQAFKVKRMVFSSSAGVYGKPQKLPIKENDSKNPENPYGETKLMVEKILSWCDKAWNLKFMSIRYFNAAGAALDGSIGEDHPEESHLIPLFLKAGIKGEEMTIFGNDYSTPDGTCIRDYIHVLDLARSHTLAMEALLDGDESDFYNAGFGRGISNLQVVEAIRTITKMKLKLKVGPRRPGDADILYASIDKIKKRLNWQPKYGFKEIIESAYLWHKRCPKGYDR